MTRCPRRTCSRGSRQASARVRSEHPAPYLPGAGSRHHVLENGAHHLLADVVLLLDQDLVVVEVLKSLLPDVGGAPVVAVAPDLLDQKVRDLDVLLPRLQRGRELGRGGVDAKGGGAPKHSQALLAFLSV